MEKMPIQYNQPFGFFKKLINILKSLGKVNNRNELFNIKYFMQALVTN